jgi:hypothetical protein
MTKLFKNQNDKNNDNGNGLKYILNRQGHPFYGYHKYGHVGSGHGAKKGLSADQLIS